MQADMLVKRPSYDEKLRRYTDSPEIKVITGIRRVGKSSILRLLMQGMMEDGFPEENVFYRKFDQFGIPVNPNAEWLSLELKEAFGKASSDFPIRVFLDEVQEVAGWEKVVRQLHTRNNTDVYITGSNAYVLSSDLATYLAGRYVEIQVHPLSFAEYLEFGHALGFGDVGLSDESRAGKGRARKSVDALLQEYLLYGGMPALFHLHPRDDEGIEENLTTNFDAVILNDVERRAKIADANLLTMLVRYVFSTSGTLFSTKKIADALTSSGRKVKPETVDNYILALKRAFALYECEQEGLAGKEVLRPLRKLYAADTGFRNLTTRFSGQDLGAQLENVVYIELRRRGYEVFVGALHHSEIDFVARRGSEQVYVQVTASLLSDSVYEREVTPLEQVPDSFPKLVLTLDGWKKGVTGSGIKVVKLADWLLSQ